MSKPIEDGMNFIEAMNCVFNGCKARIASWPPSVYIHEFNGSIFWENVADDTEICINKAMVNSDEWESWEASE